MMPARGGVWISRCLRYEGVLCLMHTCCERWFLRWWISKEKRGGGPHGILLLDMAFRSNAIPQQTGHQFCRSFLLLTFCLLHLFHAIRCHPELNSLCFPFRQKKPVLGFLSQHLIPRSKCCQGGYKLSEITEASQGPFLFPKFSTRASSPSSKLRAAAAAASKLQPPSSPVRAPKTPPFLRSRYRGRHTTLPSRRYAVASGCGVRTNQTSGLRGWPSSSGDTRVADSAVLASFRWLCGKRAG
ncbi:hypothetical protein QBC47DRAFT_161388 [Echria macrotheca]|uniref:Uncharacterized protein n=1 Tax=Echria macrotheca TaxID=438768 RepID=A0AAJ0BI52_9PEZI|nr:hypothetical protein QBC47DRAFT_161388 [Echria macrotheca]